MCAGTSPCKVLILVSVRWWNANAFYALNLARVLKRHGHPVWVGGSRHSPALAKARKWKLPWVDLDFSARNPLHLLRNFWRLLGFIRREGIQVISSHRPEDSTFGWLAQMLCGAGHVVTRGDQRPIGRSRFGRLRYERADAVVLTCRSLLAQNHRVLGPIRSKISVIYGSVDECRFNPRLAPSGPSPGLRVGWVGRLDPVKDPDTFLRAAARVAPRLPELEFIMAAAPANLNHDQIGQRVKVLGLANRLVLLPRVPDIARHMTAMDLGVITSRGSEVISRVLLEFLALGKPVLGTTVNAIGEMIEPGVNGDRFNPGDDRALARLMTAWARDPDQRSAYAAGARQTYAQHYGEDSMYRRYQALLAAAGGQSPHGPLAARPR